MIPIAQINQCAKKYSVPAESIEKDYVISWILSCFAKSKLSDLFVFYGGTAIKRIFFEEHRFSEDIDLKSERHFSSDELIANLNLEYARDEINLTLTVDHAKMIVGKREVQVFVSYTGYDEIAGVPKEVKLDFQMGDRIIGEVSSEPVIHSYSDLVEQCAKLKVLTLNSLLANKLSLLIDLTRNEPRDVYDIWFLLNRIDQFDFDAKKVAKFYKERYSIPLSVSTLLTELNSPAIRRKWENRLVKQVANLPYLGSVIEEIKSQLEILFKTD